MLTTFGILYSVDTLPKSQLLCEGSDAARNSNTSGGWCPCTPPTRPFWQLSTATSPESTWNETHPSSTRLNPSFRRRSGEQRRPSVGMDIGMAIPMAGIAIPMAGIASE